ncbi:pyridoxal kinase [Phtheirospermum japonicum]|uniref:pyridoxal kinase n=1 Tax=Phtheirospermum japonicum TaxID=374723 RepID=A0A830C7R4_9LAMI|nr:pyridoxal kinase [Phtheirospermum japonicum]
MHYYDAPSRMSQVAEIVRISIPNGGILQFSGEVRRGARIVSEMWLIFSLEVRCVANGEFLSRFELKFFTRRGVRSTRGIKNWVMAPPPVLALALPSETGRVLSIQSHTVQGYVGNKSAVFPLQLLGYPTFKGQVLNGDQLWDIIEGLEANNLLYYTHLLTGYIGSASFLNTVLKAVDKLRSINPGLTYVCDPVLGDEGKLYVPQEMVSVYREKVVPVASMLTPNQFEAELLTGSRIVSEKDGREACNSLHAAGPSKGTGDLMTALLLGWSNKYPDNLDKAAELSVSSLQALLVKTVNDYTRVGHDCQSSSLEIRLIQSQDDIRNPEVKYKAEIYE